jgi:hypothetical protein
MARQSILPVGLQPLGASRDQAAAYLSLSPGKFQELVDRRLMPSPKHIGARLVWDLEDVRSAFKALSADGEDDETWSDVNGS